MMFYKISAINLNVSKEGKSNGINFTGKIGMNVSSFELAIVRSRVRDRVTNTAHVWAGWGNKSLLQLETKGSPTGGCIWLKVKI